MQIENTRATFMVTTLEAIPSSDHRSSDRVSNMNNYSSDPYLKLGAYISPKTIPQQKRIRPELSTVSRTTAHDRHDIESKSG